ncbi:MAG: glutaredoxin domain-containing protein [Ornithinimicrobium sp.]|uniref:glutaredoxin domain-containing protein n=1 Tax=Ornithinimicrobium sp. TaxID=1977084 RepID=UPI0026DF5209|nr:glutaredoxin domain-containing protein [Ornithinimicrobium sp.]MDO5740256.1 glutaredoxin domain-containing protein [Ornithinimicrobium sp.]
MADLTTTADEADPAASTGVLIYWRPGCGFCLRLRMTLGEAGERATWVNIWDDEEAAAFVRSVNAGNETVPTVVMDGVAVTNPSPRKVLKRLKQE